MSSVSYLCKELVLNFQRVGLKIELNLWGGILPMEILVETLKSVEGLTLIKLNLCKLLNIEMTVYCFLSPEIKANPPPPPPPPQDSDLARILTNVDFHAKAQTLAT